MMTKNIAQRYAATNPPAYDAAFIKGVGNGMAGTLAASTSGQDDQLWIAVN